jgi:hypothetical protein
MTTTKIKMARINIAIPIPMACHFLFCHHIPLLRVSADFLKALLFSISSSEITIRSEAFVEFSWAVSGDLKGKRNG